LEGFASLLKATAETGQHTDTLKEWTNMAVEMTKLVAKSGPWMLSDSLPACPQPHMEIYLCGRSLHELAAHLCRDQNYLPPANELPYGILVIKSSKQIECGA